MGDTGYYTYVPSKAGAGIFMVLFGASAFVHLWQMAKTKTWFFTAFLIGAFSSSSIQNEKFHFGTLTTLCSSDDIGLHFPIDLSTQSREPCALHLSVDTYHSSSLTLCRHDLHDIRSYCGLRWKARNVYCLTLESDQNLCFG